MRPYGSVRGAVSDGRPYRNKGYVHCPNNMFPKRVVAEIPPAIDD